MGSDGRKLVTAGPTGNHSAGETATTVQSAASGAGGASGSSSSGRTATVGLPGSTAPCQ